ncbi:(4Fe-4S)-binding protein [Streptomyces phytohabitans]|uniref:(4Fe-4S)-binding protein n=1 Tax=Streptomyces phytohabitans TaxID=1150371 RepID=UPI00345BC95B
MSEIREGGGAGRKAYEGRSVIVTFEAGRCRHAAVCVHGLPEVFDPGARPWVRPDAAEAERVVEVVRRCPSGALRYALVDRAASDGGPDAAAGTGAEGKP